MRVLFVAPRFYPCPGGYENYVLALARGLQEGGHQVTVATTNAWDLESFWVPGRARIPASAENYRGISIRRFSISHDLWRRRAGRLLALLPSWKLKAQYARPSFRVPGLMDFLKETPAEVVHIGPLPYSHLMYAGLRAAKIHNARLVATPCTHFGEAGSSEISRHYTQPFQAGILNRCDSVLALTQVEARELAALGVSTVKLHHVGFGPTFPENPGLPATFRDRWNIRTPIVLHLGMKAPDKGSIQVVEAMKELWAHGIAACLVMAGGSLRSFDDYIAAQQLPSQRLLNLPAITEAEKWDLLSAATVVVQPSRVESLGLVNLEAWLSAKPVIAADIPVMREVITHGTDGLLVPFGDAKSLAESLLELLSEPQKRERMGRAGQIKVRERFSWPVAWKKIYPELLGTQALK